MTDNETEAMLEDQKPDTERTNLLYEIDDIIYTSWGYDQTNVEWFKVLARIGKQSLLVVQICGDCKETGFMSGTTYPVDEIATEPVYHERDEAPTREPVKAYKVRVDKGGVCNMDPGKNGYQRNGYKYDKTENEGHYMSWYA